METPVHGKVAIIGSGLIGRSLAVMFAKAGFKTVLYDNDPRQIESALQGCKNQLLDMESAGVLTGPVKLASEALTYITGSHSLAEAMEDSIYVQECIPENLALKKKIFSELDKHATSTVVLASSTSCLVPSLFTEELKYRNRCIVAHPINPPYYIPLVEVIPAPWTSEDVVEKTRSIMKQIGQAPVLAKKEVNGFILNRLQYAVIMEAWRLVEDGTCSPEDVDTTVTEGLGLRYSLIGPFETMHLNATGIKDYCERYGQNILRICEEQGKPRPLTGETMEMVHSAMCQRIPLDSLNDRRKWRDEKLAELSKHKKGQEKQI